MKKRILLLFLGVAVIGVLAAEHPTQPFMRKKLGYAQGVLEGITLEKFDLVQTNAALLRDMSQTNVFRLLGNRAYLANSSNFQASIDELTAAAKDKNLERATRAYSSMAQACVECHKTFRREQFILHSTEPAAPK